MRTLGFRLVTMGRGGPALNRHGEPEASIEDQKRAIELNSEWDRVRTGQAEPPSVAKRRRYPEGSVGDAYERAMALRLA